MDANLSALLYLVASVCFIMALRGLSSPETARGGNLYGIVGMIIAIVTTILGDEVLELWTIVAGMVIGGSIGSFIAVRIQMTALPQLVAAFHSLVGLAAVLVAAAAMAAPAAYGIGVPGDIKLASLIEISLGTAIGAITFTGSVIAFGKLQGLITGNPLVFPGQHPLNAILGLGLLASGVWLAVSGDTTAFWALTAIALLLGVLLIVPIGGADMPVVISMLNSYSGWAAAGIGFTLQNNVLIVVGALVGSSGAILSYIMCKGMNRSIFNVLLGGFGGESAGPAAAATGDKPVKSGSAEDAAFLMKNAQSVIIVPGYGMAAASIQETMHGDVIHEDIPELGWVGSQEMAVITWELFLEKVPLTILAQALKLSSEDFAAKGVTTFSTRIPFPKVMSGYATLAGVGQMPIRLDAHY